MYAFEFGKSNRIIYNNLLSNKHQELQDDCQSFIIILAIKLWLLRYQLQVFMNDNDGNSERYG